jgi:hypothetical protein
MKSKQDLIKANTPRSHTITLEGHLFQNQEKEYYHVPFPVPQNAVRLDVDYAYSSQISSDPTVVGGNTIDLGIFDERGTEFLRAGFRGWSGSERLNFFISETDATPGYMAGPIGAGTWNVLLGLYKIADSGCTYRLSITITTQENHPGSCEQMAVSYSDLPSTLPPAHYSPWLRGELHCHTWHSDGNLPPNQLVELAREHGLDFLAVTDHNTISAQRELETINSPGLILIRGVESTTFKGHFNCWGIPDWIDFRISEPDQMRTAVQYARDLGAITSCGHPKPYGPDWEFRDVNNHHCIEVWNGPWTGFNEVSLDYWTNLLAAGRRMTAVGGSDYHRLGEMSGLIERDLGTPTNWVFVPETPTSAKILDSIQKGHVSISETPSGPFIELRGGQDMQVLQGDQVEIPSGNYFPIQVRCKDGANCLLRILDQGGVLAEYTLISSNQTLDFLINAAQSRFCRVELRSVDERMIALSNPIYFFECFPECNLMETLIGKAKFLN